MMLTILRIQFLRLRNNPLELLLVFVMPVLFFSIFAMIFSKGIASGSEQPVRLGLAVPQRTTAAESLLLDLAASETVQCLDLEVEGLDAAGIQAAIEKAQNSGRYDLVLKFVATHPGCANGDIDAHTRSVDPASEKQVGGYIKVLRERFGMIDRLQPIFAKPRSRNGRFYIADNFLRSWLAALQTATAAVHFRPLAQLVAEADQRLMEAEGHGLERLVATLYAERSRKGLVGFSLTHRVEGFWDKADRAGTQIEIDLVALDEHSRTIRLGTCKRQGDKLIADLPRFERHIAGFLARMPKFATWAVERVAIAPLLTGAQRSAAEQAGYIPQDLNELTAGL